MSDTSASLLQQAYTLIENEELEAAQELLAPLLEEDANNVHLWWVYTHALRDTGMGQAALERVLDLDPQYPGARELKADVLEAQLKDPDLVALEASEPGADQSASEFNIDDWESLKPAADASDDSSSSPARLLLIGILIAVIIGGGLVLSGAVDLSPIISEILQTPEPQVIVVSEPTSEPGASEGDIESAATLEEPAATAIPTLAATAEAVAELPPALTAAATVDAEETPAVELSPAATTQLETEAPPEVDAEEVADFLGLVAAAIDEFEIDQSQSGTISTNLGATLVIHVCAIPGPEFNARLNMVLTSVVSLADDLPENVEAVAVGLLNCDDPAASLRIIGVARSVLADFANEEIEARDYQRAWQPLP
ncbi:MAG: hypothetical protein OXI34_06700 [Chloroflexota bacterium]|nr:hypothetical protein [Chloroflexota bacterium]MDE2946302.1 hypothetical protein [Chloroflexota bacterium]